MESIFTVINFETIAVVLALAYLVLAIQQNIWCWVAGLASTFIYLFVFFKADLYMESALQIFYIAISFYGIWEWKYGGKRGVDNTPGELKVTTWTLKQHIVALSVIVGLALISGSLLKHYTNAALPFIDSLTTWGGIVTTYMVARKVLENWHYWFIIDSVSIYLYISRDLKQTALLFAIYLVLIVVGYKEWKKSMRPRQLE